MGPATLLRRPRFAQRHGMTVLGGAPGVFTHLKLTPGRSREMSKVQVESESEVALASELDALKMDTLYAIKELAANPNVVWAEPNYEQEPHAVPNDPLYARQRWHYELLRLPDAWNVTTGNANVIAAVIDSGVLRHPEFSGRLVYGYDFIVDVINADDGNGRDADSTDPGKPPSQVGGSYGFHGTHVAGTVGAIGNNGADVTGVAWNVRVMPLRVCGVNTCFGADTIQAMLYAARLANASGLLPAQRADVINLSLGSESACPQQYQTAIDQVRAAGVVVVAAAGNDSRQGLKPAGSPANCNGVIGVAALGIDSQRAPYSNAGLGTDVGAPGGDDVNQIFSTFGERVGATYSATTQFIQGTSMAAPHVTGVISLMKSVNPALTPANIDTLLSSGALTDDIGPAGPDRARRRQAQCAEGRHGGIGGAREPSRSAFGSAHLVEFRRRGVNPAGDGSRRRDSGGQRHAGCRLRAMVIGYRGTGQRHDRAGLLPHRRESHGTRDGRVYRQRRVPRQRWDGRANDGSDAGHGRTNRLRRGTALRAADRSGNR